MSIFRDVINEFYVADTSRKIKAVFKKGEDRQQNPMPARSCGTADACLDDRSTTGSFEKMPEPLSARQSRQDEKLKQPCGKNRDKRNTANFAKKEARPEHSRKRSRRKQKQ